MVESDINNLYLLLVNILSKLEFNRISNMCTHCHATLLVVLCHPACDASVFGILISIIKGPSPNGMNKRSNIQRNSLQGINYHHKILLTVLLLMSSRHILVRHNFSVFKFTFNNSLHFEILALGRI